MLFQENEDTVLSVIFHKTCIKDENQHKHTKVSATVSLL